MTILTDIIQQAFRDANLIPIGTSPTAAETAEGLKRLQVLIRSVLGNEAGENLTAIMVGNTNVVSPQGSYDNSQEWTLRPLPLNVRAMCNLTGAQTLYANPNPQDGSRFSVQDAASNFATFNLTIVGNGRLLEGSTANIVLSTDDIMREWFYRADLGDWKRVTSLVAADEMPYPEEFDDLFIVMLAMRLNPRNSQALSQESAAMMERSREQFRARYSQIINTPSDLGVLNLGQQFYGGRRYNIYNGWSAW